MKIYERILLLAAAVSCYGMSGGGGVVLETGTGKPVAGATVTLECRRNRFLEGSDVIKELRAVTDGSGRFSFTTLDVLRCDFAYVHALKDGYVSTDGMDLRYGHDDYSTIPSQIVITPATEATMQRLNYLAAMARATSSPTPWYLYLIIYGEFSEAKHIAKQDREIAFVVAAFCPRLTALYSTLTEQDRARVHGQSVMTGGGVPAVVDHKAQVEPYCRQS